MGIIMLLFNFESFSFLLFSFPSSFLTARVSCTVELLISPFSFYAFFSFPLLFQGLGVVSVFGFFPIFFLSSSVYFSKFSFSPPSPFPSSTKGMFASTSSLVRPALSCIIFQCSFQHLSVYLAGRGVEFNTRKITLFLALSLSYASSYGRVRRMKSGPGKPGVGPDILC